MNEVLVKEVIRAMAYATAYVYPEPKRSELFEEHWSWYIKGRGAGQMADYSSFAAWEKQARAAIAVVEERLKRLVYAVHEKENILTEGQLAKIMQTGILDVRRLWQDGPG